MMPSFPAWWNGAAGVDIFFVISGLVMTLSHTGQAAHPGRARTFLARRAERVVPLYWLLTTAKVGLLLALPAVTMNGLGSVWHIVASYLFLPSVGPFGVYPILIVGWTLTFEILFYLFFAAALWLRIPLLFFLTPVLALVSLAHVLVHPAGPVLLTLLDPIMVEFLFGVVLGEVWLARRLPEVRLCWAMLGAGFVLISLLPGAMLRPLFWGVPALLIVAGALGLETTLAGRLPAWLLGAGNSSYSLYLTHTLVLPVLGVLALHLHAHTVLPVVLCALGAIVVCLPVNEICYRLLELPLMRHFRLQRLRAAPLGKL